MSSSATALSQAKTTTTTTTTPVKQTTTPVRAVTDSPGNWKHPRLAEITRRQSKNVFSEKHIKQIVYNVGALAAIGVLRQVVLPHVPGHLIPAELQQYSTWVYAAVVVIPVVNIALALLPLVRPRDDLSDIPLTPAQRRLLGLPPSSRPATPDSAYSTPPRYSRTPSLAGSPSAAAAAAAGGSNSIRSYASSPLSNVATPGGTTAPYSPSPSKLSLPSQHSPSSSAVSPLLHKAVGGSGALARAPLPPPSSSSFGSPGSPLGASTSSSLFGASTSSLFGASTSSSVFGDGPPTPTPVGGKRSSVSLNSKWLYERGRRASSSNWLHQNR